ncbi:MAG: transposase DNA-binding-containing protein [Steroidobacterales bacterium]
MPNKHVRARQQQSVADADADVDWLDRELGDCAFSDERLGKRFRSLLEQLSSSPGGSIPLVCQDWANTKAAYRFLDNDRGSEAEILAGHFEVNYGARRGLRELCEVRLSQAQNRPRCQIYLFEACDARKCVFCRAFSAHEAHFPRVVTTSISATTSSNSVRALAISPRQFRLVQIRVVTGFTKRFSQPQRLTTRRV